MTLTDREIQLAIENRQIESPPNQMTRRTAQQVLISLFPSLEKFGIRFQDNQ
jgi:hypothetical protein